MIMEPIKKSASNKATHSQLQNNPNYQLMTLMAHCCCLWWFQSNFVVIHWYGFCSVFIQSLVV